MMSRLSIVVRCGFATATILNLQSVAIAGEQFPFYLESSGLGQYIKCTGPYFRESQCTKINTLDRFQFYTADDNIFTAIGKWQCRIYPNDECILGWDDTVDFCGPGKGNSSKTVELTFDPYSGPNALSVNQASSCFGAPTVARGVLGQNGEADETPAQDTDTYRFAGRAGERVEVSLDRDGSTGSLGAVVTLRLRTEGGSVLGERTGPVPLSLDATLPGEVEIVVLRDGKTNNALRGGYEIAVTPASGDFAGRILRPSENVEG